MYVCICNAVSDTEIHAEIALGADSVEELGRRLRVATCCGSCHDEAQAIIDTYDNLESRPNAMCGASRYRAGAPALPAAVVA